MKKIRFALIGCGRIGLRHAGQMNDKGELVAVCDVVKEKADHLASLYSTRAYSSIEDLLHNEKDIDVVAVCTPNGLHAEHSIKGLLAGFHVLCEKPMAIKVSQAKDMIATAKKAGKHLLIVKQNRYNPPVSAVKKAFAEGRLGKLYSVQLNCFWNRHADYYKDAWRGTCDMDGGTLFTQFSHFIDLLYWIAGDVTAVTSVLANYAHQGIIEFEDTGMVLLKFENGAIGTLNYTVNSYQRNMEGSCTLFCEKGTVKIGGQYLNELEYQQIDNYSIENLPAANSANQYDNYEGSMSNHDKVYDNLIASLLHGEAFTTTAEEGLKTVEIIEKIYAIATRI